MVTLLMWMFLMVLVMVGMVMSVFMGRQLAVFTQVAIHEGVSTSSFLADGPEQCPPGGDAFRNSPPCTWVRWGSQSAFLVKHFAFV